MSDQNTVTSILFLYRLLLTLRLLLRSHARLDLGLEKTPLDEYLFDCYLEHIIDAISSD